jgi:SAM-dependent methyltransferase
VAHAGFETAHAVCELGCGTGRFAAHLLSAVLPPDAHYVGVDISARMVRLASSRLRQFADRAVVRRSDGSPALALPADGFDRFVSTYVLDLLSTEMIAGVLAEAWRALAVDGRLCLVSLADGRSPLSRLVSGAWKMVHAARPSLVGGCRPIRLTELLPRAQWSIAYQQAITSWGITSEVVVAAKSISSPAPSDQHAHAGDAASQRSSVTSGVAR